MQARNTFFFLGSLVVASVLGGAGCAATALNPKAARVMVSRTAAPAGCVYVGSVVGEQGGSFTGKYTSNANLAEGAFNDLKNKAFAMGANYVVLEDTHAGNTMSGDRNGISGGQTDVTHVGNAFRCPVTDGAPASANGAPPPVTAPQGARSAKDVVIVGF